MAKKDKAVYAPGELSRVREKLGVVDQEEAKRMVNVLGGTVGYERTDEQEQNKTRVRHERVDVKIGNQGIGRGPKHRVELPPEDSGHPEKKSKAVAVDDPSVNQKSNYWDRVRLDKFAGQSEFEIKSPGQVLFSVLSVFGAIPDYVNPVFISKRMREYYKQLETLVISTRSLFPRNNLRRNEKLKKSAPLAFAILDTIRYWNIDKLSTELTRLQVNPRNIKVEDCAEILRIVYRPLLIMENMDMEAHIRAAFKILYKALYIENPSDAQTKYQDLIRSALTAYNDVQKDIRYLMYPLLMKSVTYKWMPYEHFFTDCKNRIMAFLKLTKGDQIDPAALGTKINAEPDSAPKEDAETKAEESGNEAESIAPVTEEEKPEETPEEQARRTAVEAEKKALDRGLQTLEVLFPNAGWDRLSSYPDLYPYFIEIFDLRRGVVNISPTDPLQQIFILMRIVEELFYGLRYVSFGNVTGPDGRPEQVGDILTDIINNWHYFIEFSFEKDYLPRMNEYVRMLEGSPEDWNSPYTKRVISDLHWVKRLYFLPFYKFESLAPPPFQKKDITQIYPEIKRLRRYLAAVGAGIETGNRKGGADRQVRCDGINNPWEAYEFQVPNPLSQRLDALLHPKNKNNASLVFFTLSVVTVLNYLVNNEDSWAYGGRPGPLFRSVKGEGVTPLTGIDSNIDADALFKAALKKRQKAQEKAQQ